MKSEHTPGPWTTYDRGIGWEVHADGQAVNSKFRDTFTEADAKLIAAAPELLDACQTVLDFLDRLEHDGDPDGELRKIRQMVRAPLRAKLKSAIAKVEGRS